MPASTTSTTEGRAIVDRARQILLAILAAVACTLSARVSLASDADVTSAAVRVLANADYRCAIHAGSGSGRFADDGFTLRDGKYTAPPSVPDSHEKPEAALDREHVAGGDVDGDGKLDAVALVYDFGEGTGVFWTANVFSDVFGKPRCTHAIFLGDRVDLKSIEIQPPDSILIEIMDHGPDEGMAQRTLSVRRKFQITADNVVAFQQLPGKTWTPYRPEYWAVTKAAASPPPPGALRPPSQNPLGTGEAATAIWQIVTLSAAGDLRGSATHEMALEVVPKPRRGDRSRARSLNEQGMALLKAERYAEAAGSFRSAAGADPGDVEVLNNLAYALLLAEDYPAAADAIVATLSAAPSRAMAWETLGQILVGLGQSDAAVGAFKMVVRTSSDTAKGEQRLQKVAETVKNPAAVQALRAALASGAVVAPVPPAEHPRQPVEADQQRLARVLALELSCPDGVRFAFSDGRSRDEQGNPSHIVRESVWIGDLNGDSRADALIPIYSYLKTDGGRGTVVVALADETGALRCSCVETIPKDVRVLGLSGAGGRIVAQVGPYGESSEAPRELVLFSGSPVCAMGAQSASAAAQAKHVDRLDSTATAVSPILPCESAPTAEPEVTRCNMRFIVNHDLSQLRKLLSDFEAARSSCRQGSLDDCQAVRNFRTILVDVEDQFADIMTMHREDEWLAAFRRSSYEALSEVRSRVPPPEPFEQARPKPHMRGETIVASLRVAQQMRCAQPSQQGGVQASSEPFQMVLSEVPATQLPEYFRAVLSCRTRAYEAFLAEGQSRYLRCSVAPGDTLTAACVSLMSFNAADLSREPQAVENFMDTLRKHLQVRLSPLAPNRRSRIDAEAKVVFAEFVEQSKALQDEADSFLLVRDLILKTRRASGSERPQALTCPSFYSSCEDVCCPSGSKCCRGRGGYCCPDTSDCCVGGCCSRPGLR